MAKFSTPSPKKKYQYEIENFLGIDLSTAPNNVAKNRSPSCPNMVRDTIGKVKKRDGITLVEQYPARINGVHRLSGLAYQYKLVHTGTQMTYKTPDNATHTKGAKNDHISVSREMDRKLWLLDGATFQMFDGIDLKLVETLGYIPTIIIARAPTGGGTLLEQINLLSYYRTEKFAGTATDKTYQLTATGINSVQSVKVMQPDGTFKTLTEITDYTVNVSLGQIIFINAPGVSPITGEDNVFITYGKIIADYSNRINKCTIMTLYGMNGARDRMFVSGNPDYPHYDFHSELNNPGYFGDLNYSVIGQTDSEIIGYSIVNDYLVTHKTNAENDNNTNLRKGTLVNGKVVFTSEGSYQTSGALAKYSFAQLENEPLYVTTQKNVSAITPSDVLGERFSQERSYYITKALQAEADLANSYAYTFDGFYCLAVGTNLYLLDGSQYAPNKERPFSHRQYECYMFQGVGARVMWEYNEELYFGTTTGAIKKFEKGSANDEGQPIIAFWDTPEFDGNSFADKKTFTYVAVRLASAPATGVKIVVRNKGIWNDASSWDVVMPYNAEASYFDLNKIDFNFLNFSTDSTPHTLGSKIKVKNVDKIQFRFENDVLDQPFGLYKVLLEYTESGKYAK